MPLHLAALTLSAALLLTFVPALALLTSDADRDARFGATYALMYFAAPSGSVALIRTLAACLEGAKGQHGLPENWATNKSLGGTDSYVFSTKKTYRKLLRPSVTLFISAWDKPEHHPVTPGMPGESWTMIDWRERPDFADTLAVGPIAYAGSADADLRASADWVHFHSVDSIADCMHE